MPRIDYDSATGFSEAVSERTGERHLGPGREIFLEFEGRAQATREFDSPITCHRGDRSNTPVPLETEGTDILYRLQRAREAGLSPVPGEKRVRNGRVLSSTTISSHWRTSKRKRESGIFGSFRCITEPDTIGTYFAEQCERPGDGEIITDAFEPIWSLVYGTTAIIPPDVYDVIGKTDAIYGPAS